VLSVCDVSGTSEARREAEADRSTCRVRRQGSSGSGDLEGPVDALHDSCATALRMSSSVGRLTSRKSSDCFMLSSASQIGMT